MVVGTSTWARTQTADFSAFTAFTALARRVLVSFCAISREDHKRLNMRYFARTHILVGIGLALVPVGAWASGAPISAPTLAQLLADSGITASGYLAATYYHSSGDNTFHQFDTEHDAFQLDQAGLTLAYQPAQGFGALVDVIGGTDAEILNAAQSATASSNDPVALLQAYLQYVRGNVTVQAGTFTTLAGAEVVAPTGDTNITRSLLFYAEPMTHTGVRVTYTVNTILSLIAGVNNGWNYTSFSSGSKTVELGIDLTPSAAFSLTAQSYIGNDPVDLARRTLIDAVATYTATPALSFVLSSDWGEQDRSAITAGGVWSGVAAYVNYHFARQWLVSVRGEALDDRDGFISGTPQTLKEGTVTFSDQMTPNFQLRLEGRYDWSNRSSFTYTHTLASTGKSVTALADHQSEVAVQGLYSF